MQFEVDEGFGLYHLIISSVIKHGEVLVELANAM